MFDSVIMAPQSPKDIRPMPNGPQQLRPLLTEMVSVAERLAVLSQSKRVDELTAIANRFDTSAPSWPDGDLREEVWQNTAREERLLSRVSKCMDQGDIQGAAQATLKLATHALHRHAKARKQFFSVGRGAGVINDYSEAEEACLCVEAALDSVIPEVKNYFSHLASADADQQAIDYVEQCRMEAQQEREIRIMRQQERNKALKQKRKINQ